MIRDMVRLARRFARSVSSGSRFYRREVSVRRERFGNPGAAFVVHPDGLSSQSIIYSFGIGTDVSFDLACIGRFHSKVHAFDPTPRSMAWIRGQKFPPDLLVYNYGVAGLDGSITLYPPANPNHVSFSVVERSGEKVECPVYKLSTIMRKLGHDHIDLLKMDIEGAEYDVIEDFLREKIPIRQFCVEFHDRWAEIGKNKTDVAIDRLHGAGYRLFDVSASGEEFSFIHAA